MLKADRVELAILNLLVGWHESTGRWFTTSSMKDAIRMTVPDADEDDQIEALLTLLARNLISINDVEMLPYAPERHAYVFYGTDFRCKALLGARRRQQELAQHNRHGVFISHINEERAIAIRLQQLLRSSLGSDLPVFVSSDCQTIRSGDPWYQAILEGIRKSQVVIALLSHGAKERRWVNFEAGFGLGQESQVIPVVCRGLTMGDIGLPLSQLHARDLHSKAEIIGMLMHLGSICGKPVNENFIDAFLTDLPSIEASIPATGLQITAWREGMAFGLAIRNVSTRPLTLIDAELLVPSHFNPALRSFSPVREVRIVREGDMEWKGHRLTTLPSPIPYLGIEPLWASLSSAMGEVPLTGLNITSSHSLSADEEKLSIRYRVSTKEQDFGPFVVPIAEIPVR